MNISAINCTPIKPQVAFGNGEDVTDAQKVLDLTRELKDSIELTKPEAKSKLQTMVSVAGAMLGTFILGKSAGAKIVSAFPNLPSNIANNSSKILSSAKNIAGKIHIPVSEKVKASMGKISSSKVAGTIKSASDFCANKVKTFVSNQGPDGLFKTALGVGSMAVLGRQIVKVDGNNDDVEDIAQKNVSAYRNAVHSVGILGEIANVLS